MNEIHYSSKSVVWETPKKFYDEVNKEFNFTLDVCANEENNKCEHYFDEKTDGLKQRWEGVCWMNPPYGRNITGKWVKKAYEESLKGAIVVCLLPARTDTIFFHEYCLKGEIRFIKGRLKFGNSKDSAPFPSMLVIFRNKD